MLALLHLILSTASLLRLPLCKSSAISLDMVLT
ncbi:hypothetical protein GLYMA_18G018750v4 [Glycine max]|nr:hypothetical protein GLYMA_18G018750v4 [Glycine max]KAH1152771.1 hypothetical protein GYH30_048740 [Glycine max]